MGCYFNYCLGKSLDAVEPWPRPVGAKNGWMTSAQVPIFCGGICVHFHFFSDAGQFGAAQGQIMIVGFILFMNEKRLKQRISG